MQSGEISRQPCVCYRQTGSLRGIERLHLPAVLHLSSVQGMGQIWSNRWITKTPNRTGCQRRDPDIRHRLGPRFSSAAAIAQTLYPQPPRCTTTLCPWRSARCETNYLPWPPEYFHFRLVCRKCSLFIRVWWVPGVGVKRGSFTWFSLEGSQSWSKYTINKYFSLDCQYRYLECQGRSVDCVVFEGFTLWVNTAG